VFSQFLISDAMHMSVYISNICQFGLSSLMGFFLAACQL